MQSEIVKKVGELEIEAKLEGTDGSGAIVDTNTDSVSSARRRRGKCKWFNVAKGWGFITPLDGGQEVFVHQSVIKMDGFRSLGDEEEVEFECKPSDKGFEAILVTGVRGEACKGSHRRPMSRRKYKKVRCYNCGEFSNHIASKCHLGPQPKKCHHCKSAEHLIGACPAREAKPKKQEQQAAVDGGSEEHKRSDDEVADGLSDSGINSSRSSAEPKCVSLTTDGTTDDAKSETSASSSDGKR